MASGSVRPTAPLVSAPSVERGLAADKLIDAQLARVRRHIRITDLIAGIMVLFAGVFAFLVVIAVIDHWIVDLGVSGRLLVLVALIAGASWHLVFNVFPLLVRKINPAYAAQTIERSEPTLKNSLLNYLLLRRESSGLHAAVYQAVQQRAAADVAQVEVDQTVDRTVLIRAGYLLAGIMTVVAAYKILSPKDPFQTVRRIASPWSDIARPARVTIADVQPGNAEVIQGQAVEISALVRGAGGAEQVKLRYSSVDGQIVDQTVDMKPDSAGLRHVGQLPPGTGGLQHDLIYRVTAGDAVTGEYHLRAIAAPTMTVESVEYEYPAYTQRAREVVDRQGDLNAVEGTRVTIRARANQQIRTATIEKFPPTVGGAKGIQERLPMQFREAEAWHIWTLELAGDRKSPKFSAYQATFTNSAGLASRDPVTHRIEVLPDLAPEIEFLTPAKETVQVPISGEQRIEIRAIDPDYGLAGVRLKAVCGGQEILDKPLLENSIGQTGQVVVEFKFRPSEFQLSVGSQVTYWGVAIDNRHSDAAPQPNNTQTPHRTLIVVDDPTAPPPKPGENANNASQKTETPDDGKASPAGDKPQPNNSNDKPSPDKQQKDSKQKDSKQKDSKQKDSKQNDSKQNGDKGPQDQQGGTPQSSGKQSSDDQQGGSSGKGRSQSGTGGQSSQQGGGNSKSEQPANSPSGQSGENQATNENSSQPTKPNGNQQPSPGSDPSSDRNPREGGQPGQRSEPVHDGEVFEKALERMNKSGKNGEKSPTNPNDPQQPGNQSAGPKQEDANAENASDPTASNEKPPGGKSKQSPTAKPPMNQAQNDKKDGSGEQNAAKKDPAKKDATEKSGTQKGTTEKGTTEKGTPENGTPEKGTPEKGTEKGATEKGTTKKESTEKSATENSSASNKKEVGEKQGTEKQPGAGDQGKSGSGQKDDGKTGSDKKTSQGDRHKANQPDTATAPPGDSPPPNESERPSETKGQESGDRSGAGKKGAGQGANQAGKDSSGSNTPSDEGAGAARESGSGEKTSSPGKQQPSPTPNGSSGNEKGPGSQSKSESPGKSGDAGGGKQSASPEKNQQPGSAKGSGDGKAGANQGDPTGGGQATDRPVGTPSSNGEVAPGDDANLEYSRRATDMVLEYLKDQKDKPDEQLLDEMGWTPEDLRAFLERWQKLKNSASDDVKARRELDESLRGVGLRPQADSKRSGSSRSDDSRGLRESGIKSAPPSSYQEQFNAFKKGASRSPAK